MSLSGVQCAHERMHSFQMPNNQFQQSRPMETLTREPSDSQEEYKIFGPGNAAVPPELFLAIVSEFSATEALKLSHVNRGWQELLAGAPEVWSKVVITDRVGSSPGARMSFLKEALTRSKAVPVELTIDSFLGNDRPMSGREALECTQRFLGNPQQAMQLIVDNISRFKKLNLNCVFNQALPSGLHARSLEHLYINNYNRPCDIPRAPKLKSLQVTATTTARSLFKESPRLEVLTIYEDKGPVSVLPQGELPDSLRSVTISFPHGFISGVPSNFFKPGLRPRFMFMMQDVLVACITSFLQVAESTSDCALEMQKLGRTGDITISDDVGHQCTMQAVFAPDLPVAAIRACGTRLTSLVISPGFFQAIIADSSAPVLQALSKLGIVIHKEEYTGVTHFTLKGILSDIIRSRGVLRAPVLTKFFISVEPELLTRYFGRSSPEAELKRRCHETFSDHLVPRPAVNTANVILRMGEK
ncbi:hypothetical protein AURDEDRAFT_167598 [Auricularia subglabra TFB-10046 SS5]|nr:hypothetical protein AURDEDRAFT_167598 [Auricularia subglabra TFB-10046 SS5]